jgi:hypothetical protein
LYDGAGFGRQIFESFDVDLVYDQQRGFSGKERFYGVE